LSLTYGHIRPKSDGPKNLDKSKLIVTYPRDKYKPKIDSLCGISLQRSAGALSRLAAGVAILAPDAIPAKPPLTIGALNEPPASVGPSRND
jgi:hypothetical protein